MTQQKPNILILHTDQQRYDSLGCTGNPHAVTPNLDRLAGEGTLFTRHISSHPVCMPSRASLLTGLSTLAHGVYTNGIPLWRMPAEAVPQEAERSYQRLHGKPFPSGIPTLADLLKEEGYATACLGKLHLQPHQADLRFGFEENYAWQSQRENEDWQGPFYGFDTARLALGHGERPCRPGGGHYSRWLRDKHPDVARDVIEGKKRLKKPGVKGDIYLSPIPSELHNSMWLANEACRMIDEAAGPFCLFVGFPDPHHSWSPPADVGKDFEDGPYPEFSSLESTLAGKPAAVQESLHRSQAPEADCIQAYRYTNAMVHLIDRAVGRIVERLKAKGLYDNTIVVFTADHGDFLGDYHCLRKDNYAYRCLVHVPFIMKAASGCGARTRVDAPMSSIDVVPTLLSAAGLGVPEHVQGRDIFSVPEDERRAFVSTIRQEPATPAITLFDRRFRYTFFPRTEEEELYDHEADPLEVRNLAGDAVHSARTRRMREEALKMNAAYYAPKFFRYCPW